MFTAIAIDATRGFDVLYGSKVLQHFTSYEEAAAFAAAGRGRWLRYWLEKGK